MKDVEALDFSVTDKKLRTKEQRSDYIRSALIEYAHYAPHSRADGWTRDDALLALSTLLCTDCYPETLTNMENTPPKVFISHASADKGRFVIGLATKLRSEGVDAWLDRWEMNPGDSLVDKIFDEGLKNCQAMIVVISRNSIDSKWVREELNIGMVRKIEQKAKLIPIRLDGCEMPVCLRATVWEDVADLSDYETQFRRILNGINGQYDKPPLGTPPAYVLSKSLQFAGLTRIDSQVFEILCSKAVDTGSVIVETRDVETALAELGITDAELIESQEILRGRAYVGLQFGFSNRWRARSKSCQPGLSSSSGLPFQTTVP